MNNFYEQLERYLAKTPIEKVFEDWNKTEAYDKIGPTVDALLENINYYQVHSCDPFTELTNTSNIFDPKFSSGFLFSLQKFNYAKSSV